jgi:hypothetical protein
MNRLVGSKANSLRVAFSQKEFTLAPISQKKVPNHCPEHYPPKEKLLRAVIWHLFFCNEKLSEIKPPLTTESMMYWTPARWFSVSPDHLCLWDP